ncbi:hypothetical protein EGW08_017208, partial [Elysia chlorotica]
TLDTPIQSFYPEFRVTDDLRSRTANFRDLLAHRMGIPGHFKPLLAGFPKGLTRDEFVRSMAHMPTWLSFRGKFRYNNYMYTVAAHVIEKMSNGRTWESLVKDLLLVPLNMSATGFFVEPGGGEGTGGNHSNHSNHSTVAGDTDKTSYDTTIPDFASSCALIGGAPRDVSPDLWLSIIPCGPAGAIYSNAEDMAKWMKFQLSSGRASTDASIDLDPSVIRATWEPSMLAMTPKKDKWRPTDPVSHVTYGYGLGWVSADYRGFRQVFHTGSYITHSSRLWLFPDLDVGIFLTVNGPQKNQAKTKLIQSVMYYAADELLGLPHWFDATSACTEPPAPRWGPSNVPLRNKEKSEPHGTANPGSLYGGSFNRSLVSHGNQ